VNTAYGKETQKKNITFPGAFGTEPVPLLRAGNIAISPHGITFVKYGRHITHPPVFNPARDKSGQLRENAR
jgi:hypothetical protein